jgi:hypothetical protein
VSPYPGRGRPPTKKRPQLDWEYAQGVEQRENGRVVAAETEVVYGAEKPRTPETHAAYVERTNLTTRHMNGQLVRKTLGFSKQLSMLEADCI